MYYKQFGRGGRYVSALSFGTWGFDTAMWRDGQSDKFPIALSIALELGVNLIDTAQIYGDGQVERSIGRVLNSQQRKNILVATKIKPKVPIELPSPHVPADQAYPGRYIRNCTEQSLKNLGLERLFLQQLHAWTPRWLSEGDWLYTLQQLQQEGKIEHYGVSIHDHDCPNALDLARSGHVHSIQAQYNLFDQSADHLLASACHASGTALIGRSPLYAGGLTGNYLQQVNFEDGDWREYFFDPDHLMEVISRGHRICYERGIVFEQLADFALSFCFSNPNFSTTLVGMRKPSHVYATVRSLNQGLLPAAMIDECRRYDWFS